MTPEQQEALFNNVLLKLETLKEKNKDKKTNLLIINELKLYFE
jgi:hypothetical protein